MTIVRQSGILLHPTSLPGPHGSGDLGKAAYHFVDWLVAGSQSLWQILPLGGVGPGNSPYMSPSAFAGNELLIDLEQLRDAGWLADSDVAPTADLLNQRVDYGAVRAFRLPRLRQAATRFFATGSNAAKAAYAAFCTKEAHWLEDYALFMALDAHHGAQQKLWQEWPTGLARRDAAALAKASATFASDCDFWCFCQWCFATQWARLKRYANDRNIQIVGDMPIFVSPHSADVWAHQHLFDLHANGSLRHVAGVPPDYFSETGQHWGNPLYRWPEHEKSGYAWWVNRFRTMLERCDVVRIDHFRGFESYWEIPAHAPNAITGHWRPGPGEAFFAALQREFDGIHLPRLKIIAEDLGIITPEVRALRAKLGLPGMRILQFAFDGHADNLYLPHNTETDSVVYTGTHDNNTTLGWWQACAEHERDYVRRYLGIRGDAIQWDLIRTASSSVAAISIIPMQDVLGLGADCRMNSPGIGQGFWEWRFDWNQVAAWQADLLAELAHLHGRVPQRGADYFTGMTAACNQQ